MSYQGALNAAKMQATPQASPSDPGLVEIGRVADHQRERLADLLQRLTQFADRVLGSLPMSDSPGGPPPVPNGIIDYIMQGQASTSGLIDALMEQELRLSRIA